MSFEYVILCEKPSVAKDIALVLGVSTHGKDYYAGNGLAITWCFGHLLEACEPQDYNPDWEKWSMDTLPVVPPDFNFKYKPRNRDSLSRLKIIASLAKDAQKMANACDAGREGEAIFREVLDYLDFPVNKTERVWLNTMTPSGIKKAWDERRPSTDQKFENLALAARVRGQADWLIGTNGTRAATVMFPRRKSSVWSIGRVQTAVLNLVVDRDMRIAQFIPEPYYGIRVVLAGRDYGIQSEVKIVVPLTMQKMGKFTRLFKNHDEACRVRNRAMLTLLEPWKMQGRAKEDKVPPPPLFNLVNLQKFCSLQLGWTAKQTLDVAQEAYERKLITYPRTDAIHLPEDCVPEIDKIYRQLWTKFVPNVAKVKPVFPSEHPTPEHIFNNKKLTDHFAIIPTDNIPATSSNSDSDVITLWKIIARRFVLVFQPTAIFTDLIVQAISEKVSYEEADIRIITANSSKRYLTLPGWVDLANILRQDYFEEEPNRGLVPPLESEGLCQKVQMYTDFSERPDMFQEDTLLSAMEAVKLGTSATRAAVIETLLGRKYLSRKKLTLTSTEHGQFLIGQLEQHHLEFLASPATTQEWETQLEMIEQGKTGAPSRQQFLANICEKTEAIVNILGGNVDTYTDRILCPKTYRPVEETPEGYTFFGFPQVICPITIAGRVMKAAEYRDILRTGEPTGPFEGFKSMKTGQSFKALIQFDPPTKKFKFIFENPPPPLLPVPK